MQTIFVSIASFRDKECPVTLKSLYLNAEYPYNVFVGVCQQNDEPDVDCAMSMDVPPQYAGQIRVIRMQHRDAKGPTFARYLCSTLWAGETYFMQVDSHTRFAKRWDTKCITMITQLKEAGFSKPILSHYPKDYNGAFDVPETDTDVPTICRAFFNDRSMVSFHGAESLPVQSLPQRNAFIAGGMMFCDSRFLKEVPFDPDLPFLFVGEEIMTSARAWSWGWDVFTPNLNIVYHFYTRSNEPKIWDKPDYSDQPAHTKVQAILRLIDTQVPKELSRNLDRYGLGSVRSVEDFFKFVGIDIRTKEVVRDFCHPEKDGQLGQLELSGHPQSESVDTDFYSYSDYTLSVIIILLVAIALTFALQDA